MYGNIVSAVTQVLTPDLIAKMASAAGISDRTIAQKVVGAAVPAILSGLAGLASKPDGGRQLADAVAKQPANMLENLTSMIGGSSQFADTGKSLLSSLLGSSSFGSLTSALGKFVGISDSSIRSLLGMLAPVVLGVLGREADGGAKSLTQLLASQKDSFAAAMPTGLSDLLTTSGHLDRTGSAASAASRVNETFRTARESVGTIARAVDSQSSSNWAYWALPLLALAGFAWYLASGEQTRPPVAELPPQANVVGGDLQSQIASAVDSVNATLQGVKDRASATDVLPKLQQATGEFDRLNALASRLPVEAREKLAETIKAATARVKTALDNVMATPGLPPNVQPVIANLRTKLDALAMTTGSLTQQRTAALADKLAYIARAPVGAIPLSTYYDQNVYNGAGERIGIVNDLLMGPDANIVAAVIGVGGFLGIGEKQVAVPFTSVQVQRRDNDWRLVMGATKETLMAAPTYEDTGVRVRLNPSPATTQK